MTTVLSASHCKSKLTANLHEMFCCTKQFFCLKTHERSGKYVQTETNTHHNTPCNLTLADLPWDEDRDAENWEYINIKPLKLNKYGIYTPQPNICIPEHMEWVLERYIHDVNTGPLYTVEEIEKELGIQSEFKYGVKPDWDWLFATMDHVPRFFEKSMDNNREKICQMAKDTRNILEDLGTRLAPAGRKSRRLVSESLHLSNVSSNERFCNPVDISTGIISEPVRHYKEFTNEEVNGLDELTDDTITGQVDMSGKLSSSVSQTSMVDRNLSLQSCSKTGERNTKGHQPSLEDKVIPKKPVDMSDRNMSTWKRFRRFFRLVF